MALSKKTKKKLLIAGGVAGGLVLVTGLAFAMSKSSSAAAASTAPTATDDDITKVVDAALVKETDPAILRQLATAMMVLPYSNPLHNKIGALQARAMELDLGHQVAQSDVNATAHVRQF